MFCETADFYWHLNHTWRHLALCRGRVVAKSSVSESYFTRAIADFYTTTWITANNKHLTTHWLSPTGNYHKLTHHLALNCSTSTQQLD